jgi:hypothetical protein
MPHFLKSGRIHCLVSRAKQGETLGETAKGAHNEVDGEEAQQHLEPPGVIHVGKVEEFNEGGQLRPILQEALFDRGLLGDKGTDD